MSIEKQIEKLTDAVTQLTAAVTAYGQGALVVKGDGEVKVVEPSELTVEAPKEKPKAKKKAAPKKEEAPVIEAEVVEKKGHDIETIDFEAVKTLALKAAQGGKVAELKTVLDKHGAPKVSELAAEKFTSFHADLAKALEA
jgi:hypothetical protein